MQVFYLSAVIFLSVLLLSLVSAQAPYLCPASCAPQHECVSFPDTSAFCSCNSGFSGAECDVAVDAQCPFNNVSATRTDFVPSSVSADFQGDRLLVNVISPLVAQRKYTRIAIDNDGANDYNCTYPGLYWSRQFSGCNDEFVASMPWSETNKVCGWVFDNTNAVDFIYRANMTVEQHDFIVPFGSRNGTQPVERITNSVVQLQLNFQKFIALSATMIVQAPITILAVIPLQNTSATERVAVIEVSTNTLHPYNLLNPTLVAPFFEGGSVEIVEVTPAGSCPNDPLLTCTQLWRITIRAGSNCSFSGDYALGFDLSCQLSPLTGLTPASCAIAPDSEATIGITLTSENLCAVVSRSVGISGNLASYRDILRSVPRSQFLVGQTIYYNASLISPQATLSSAVVSTVKLVSPGFSDILLFESGTDFFPSAAFSVDGSGSTWSAFRFTLADDFIAEIPEDSQRAYQLVARIDVTYLGVAGKKRLVLADNLNSQKIGLTSALQLDGPEAELLSNPANRLNGAALAVTVGSLAAVALLN